MITYKDDRSILKKNCSVMTIEQNTDCHYELYLIGSNEPTNFNMQQLMYAATICVTAVRKNYNTFTCTVAVSYTHLDVYKRQG